MIPLWNCMLVSRGDRNAPWSISFARIQTWVMKDRHNRVRHIKLWSWEEYLQLCIPVSLHQHSPGGLVKYNPLDSSLDDSGSASLGWGLQIYVLTHFQVVLTCSSGNLAFRTTALAEAFLFVNEKTEDTKKVIRVHVCVNPAWSLPCWRPFCSCLLHLP